MVTLIAQYEKTSISAWLMTKEAQAAGSESRKFVAVDPSKCTGCGICEYVCALEKSEAPWNPLVSRIRVLRFNSFLNAAMACRFCEDARCVTACPEKALAQSEANSVLIVDERKCKGCDWCIQACPHGGLALHPEKHLVMACDLCGGEPKCVDSCPEEALELVSDDEAAEKKWNTAIERLPSEIEKLADIVKKREWSHILEDAEERAVRTSEKLEAISKRERSNKKG
jgi:carbon-monoxide dehydrogenase iron sulfur subunit